LRYVPDCRRKQRDAVEGVSTRLGVQSAKSGFDALRLCAHWLLLVAAG